MLGRIAAAIALIMLGIPSMAVQRDGVSDLENGFRTVPDSVKTAVYWYWLQNNISREGVVKDLEAMKKAGINRAFIGNQGNDALPEGNVRFGSDEWWEVTRTALRTATELGIEIGIFNCPGWSQSGGPWIREEQSMRYVETAFTDFCADGERVFAMDVPESVVSVLAFPKLKGRTCRWNFRTEKGEKFTAKLDVPSMFTARSLVLTPAVMVNSRARLICGGETVAEFDVDRHRDNPNVGFRPMAPVSVSLSGCNGCQYMLEIDAPATDTITVELSENPIVGDYAGKSLAKMFQEPLPMWDHYMWGASPECSDPSLTVDPSETVDLLASASGGKICWAAPAGDWTIMTAYMKTTGVVNSPAVAEATGLEVDKMSRKHIESHFDAFLGEIIRRIPPEERACWKVVVEDSYETGSLNWTDDMKPVFISTYGYDPTPYLPALAGIVVGSPEQSDRFLWDLRRLVADRVAGDYVGGLRDISHRYGLQTWLENYGHWGFPGEFLQYGGQSDQVAGEYWSEGTLGDIENRAASSCGHIYGKKQIWAESCTAAGKPYQRYPRIMKQRVDRFFCEGINANLLHLFIQQPDDREPGLNAWYGNEFNRKNTWFGALDVFTDYLKRCNFMLQQGRYVADVAYFIGEDAPKMTGVCDPPLPEGYSFDYINAEVLKDMSHVENGMLVLESGMKYRVLVLPRQNTMRPEMLECIASLVRAGLTVLGPAPEKSPSLSGWGEADGRVRSLASEIWNGSGRYGEGRVYPDGTRLEDVLADLGIEPDFRCTPDGGVAFIHRTLDDGGELYFVANQEDRKKHFDAGFRVDPGLHAGLWNPVTGEIRAADSRGGSLCMDLDALESVFVVFRHKQAGKCAHPTIGTEELQGRWTVDFSPSCGNDAFGKTFPVLQDWSRSDDARVKYYSGSAVYSKDFELSAKQARHCDVRLSLGNVMVMAKVYVNGSYAGGSWTAPYSLDISPFVKKGTNNLRIVVYNNWNNRLVGDSLLPEDSRQTWTPVGKWNSKTPLQPSGLLGPVSLTFSSR